MGPRGFCIGYTIPYFVLESFCEVPSGCAWCGRVGPTVRDHSVPIGRAAGSVGAEDPFRDRKFVRRCRRSPPTVLAGLGSGSLEMQTQRCPYTEVRAPKGPSWRVCRRCPAKSSVRPSSVCPPAGLTTVQFLEIVVAQLRQSRSIVWQLRRRSL